MDFKDNITIFTYGTLMRGFPNERVIESFPHKNYLATVENMEMYDVGSFPALVRGSHTYQGELVVFDASVNKLDVYQKMDWLEGYHKDDPANSLYTREPVVVYVDGNPVATEVYLWVNTTRGLWYIDPEKFAGYKDYVLGRV